MLVSTPRLHVLCIFRPSNTNPIVSNFAQYNDEHIGEVFQDTDNMAAILMRKQSLSDDLLMVSAYLDLV